jgi:hypothetical protein
MLLHGLNHWSVDTVTNQLQIVSRIQYKRAVLPNHNFSIFFFRTLNRCCTNSIGMCYQPSVGRKTGLLLVGADERAVVVFIAARAQRRATQ